MSRDIGAILKTMVRRLLPTVLRHSLWYDACMYLPALLFIVIILIPRSTDLGADMHLLAKRLNNLFSFYSESSQLENANSTPMIFSFLVAMFMTPIVAVVQVGFIKIKRAGQVIKKINLSFALAGIGVGLFGGFFMGFRSILSGTYVGSAMALILLVLAVDSVRVVVNILRPRFHDNERIG